jgi:hypothetical protein
MPSPHPLARYADLNPEKYNPRHWEKIRFPRVFEVFPMQLFAQDDNIVLSIHGLRSHPDIRSIRMNQTSRRATRGNSEKTLQLVSLLTEHLLWGIIIRNPIQNRAVRSEKEASKTHV